MPLPVSVEYSPHGRLHREIEASVYFLISEALTNVVKHARASRACVGVRLEGPDLTVEVADDGLDIPECLRRAAP